MKIALLGYMGSGKSTIGRHLSQFIDIPFIDLDAEIEKAHGKTIANLFKEKGEIYFRKEETRILEALLHKKESFILSMGGGTPVFARNMELIKANCHSFYLQASPDLLTKRLFLEKAQRPLISHLSTEKELKTYIAQHLFERNKYYQQADYIIALNEDRTIDDICTEIKKLIVRIN